jgi:hypothetical protein
MIKQKNEKIKEDDIINVPYCIQTIDGKEFRGYMKRKEVGNILANYGKVATEEIKETKAKHILYGIKEYDKSGALKIVRLYIGYEMNDKSFYEFVNKSSGLVYAVHSKGKV